MPNFTDELIEYAKSLKEWDIKLDDRQPIRGLSIDDEKTRDIDDTIWVEKKGDVYVCDIAIADTAEYIQPDSPLFEVASINIVTQYLKDFSLQMIPALLSKNFLSLKPRRKRPVINFHIELDAQLEVIYFEISERRVKNAAKLSYEDVAKILTDKEDDSEVRNVLLNAYELSMKLSTKRRLMGAFAYFDSEKGLYTDEEGNIKIFASKSVAISYMIVQEMMVLTNTETAKYFAERDIPFAFRNHTVKGNIPDRDEVHNQLTHALQNRTMFKSFVQRMNIWNNKAQYGTELSGHYALNLPAYAHVTSPLRRFADMMNHVIIKAHVTGRDIPLSVEQIKEYCEKINQHMLKEKKDKHEHFKNEAYAEMAEKLEQISSEDLPEISAKEFKQMLKTIRDADNIKPTLKNEILRRIEDFSIASIDLYYLLFESAWIKNEQELRDKILESIPKRQGLATELLTLMKVQEKILDFEEVLGVEADMFTAYSVIRTLESKYMSCENISKSKSKKGVIDEARGLSLIAFLNGEATETEKPEVNKDEILMPAQFVKEGNMEVSAMREYKFANPIGFVQEVSVKRSDMSVIAYEINQIEEKPPKFECVLKIKYANEIVEFFGEGENKKKAKFEAAHAAAERFEHLNVAKKATKIEQLKGLISDKHYLNAVNFACTINEVELPIYNFDDISEDANPQFLCSAYLSFRDNNFTAESVGQNKKEAKMGAAKMILDSLIQEFPDILEEEK